MNVKHKNGSETFRLLVSLGSAYDGENFTIVFSTGKLKLVTYTCSYDGSTYTNCEKVDDTHILCTLDNAGFPDGMLVASITVEFEDSKLEDGTYEVGDTRLVEALDDNNVPYHIMITQGASDTLTTPEVVWTLLGTVLHGDKGDKGDDGLTTKVKVNGTTYEQVDGLIDLGNIGGGTSGVPEAPADGKTYARKDATWVDVSGYYTKPSDGIPATDMTAAVQASLALADSALQSYTESDPTVPSWAKADTKPTYTASEITNSEGKNLQAWGDEIALETNSLKGTNSSALSGDDKDTVEGGMRYNIHLTADAPSLSINTINDSEYESIIYLTIDSDAELAEVSLPTTYKAIGDIPSFEAGKSYEISILKSIIVCGEITDTDTTTEEE